MGAMHAGTLAVRVFASVSPTYLQRNQYGDGVTIA